MIDLVALVADLDAEWTLRTLLEKRTQALRIRHLTFKIIRETGHDAGVYQRAPDLLRVYISQAAYALVMLDREGSGREHHQTAVEIETDLEERLQRNGWLDACGRSRCAVIVLDPELETWVWSFSPHVPAVLGVESDALKEILADFPRTPAGKPQRPKEAMEAALRRARKPFSAAIFRELAEKVSLQASERAFNKLRSTLQTWFPMQENTP